MMHSYPFFQMLLYTLQYANLDCAVREMDTKELGFEFSETFFIFYCLLPFSLDFFFFSLPAYLGFNTVVLGLKVFGAKVPVQLRYITDADKIKLQEWVERKQRDI